MPILSGQSTMRNLHSYPPRLFILLLILCVVNTGFWIVYHLMQSKFNASYEIIRTHKSGASRTFEAAFREWKEKTPACLSPSHIDPNDPVVNKYLRSESFTCLKSPSLTSLDQRTGLLSHVKSKEYTCFYSFFHRKHGEDNTIIYEKVNRFGPGSVRLTNERNLVNTSCIYKGRRRTFYINTHLLVPRLKSDEVSSPDRPSVFIFFLESLTQLSFKRFMKKTSKSLRDLRHVQYLDYFVKPLDNSFPNTLAMLTGRRIEWTADMRVRMRRRKEYFDDKYRYLWQDFKEAGYVTAFEEDMSQCGIFNSGKRGFRDQPCDYNPRSYWVQMYPEVGDFDMKHAFSHKHNYCFHQNGPKITLFLDHARWFLQKNHKHPFFGFFFHSQMTHSNFNHFQMVDTYIARFMSSSKRFLNNAILIFAGDHGSRMGGFVPTAMGRIEERMNLVTIRVPDGVDRRYPHLRKFLHANKNSLLSWYDIHHMLKSIANGDFRKSSNAVGSFPSNPMVEFVPRNRTCSQANIDDVYCVCNDVVNVDPNGGFVRFDVELGKEAVQRFLDKKWKVKSCTQHVNMTLHFSYHIPGPGRHFTPREEANITVMLSPSNLTFKASLLRIWNEPGMRYFGSRNSDAALESFRTNKFLDFQVIAPRGRALTRFLDHVNSTCKRR